MGVSIADDFTGRDPDDVYEIEARRRHEFSDEVAKRLLRLQVDREAHRRFADLTLGAAPPFDAGLLGEVLQRDPEPAPRVEGLIPATGGTLVVAQRKTGKTTFELNLARALITGDDFLGRFGVRRLDGNVALLNFEVSGAQLASWAEEHKIDRNRLLLVNLRDRRNPFRHPDDLERLTAILRTHDVESLIVDPFGRAYTGEKQNDPGEVQGWLTALDQFARGTDGPGCSDLILAAHAGWNGERTRGASALEDWADSVITLTRDKDDDTQRFLRAEGRDVLVDEDALHFNGDTRTLTMSGTGSRRTAAKVRQLEALMPLVAELLEDTPGMSGNALDVELAKSDLPHSKGDGNRAGNLLVKRGYAESKQGKRRATLFYLTSPPTSLNPPQGTQTTSPTPLYRGGKSEGESQAADRSGESDPGQDTLPNLPGAGMGTAGTP